MGRKDFILFLFLVAVSIILMFLSIKYLDKENSIQHRDHSIDYLNINKTQNKIQDKELLCKIEYEEALSYSRDKICTMEFALMSCPHHDMIVEASNGCIISYLSARGWKRIIK